MGRGRKVGFHHSEETKNKMKGNISRKTRIIQTTEKVKYAEETKALEQQKKKISNEIKQIKKRK